MPEGYALFDTAIGRCGIAWGDRGIVSVQLPENTEDETRARLNWRRPQAREGPPPTHVRLAIDAIKALMLGDPADLSAIVLDMDGVSRFHRRVFQIARAIPAGRTLTYAGIADQLGDPAGARAVGEALSRNPFPIIVPCHRVLAANGKLGGFSASGGTTTKRRMLMIEGALLQLDL